MYKNKTNVRCMFQHLFSDTYEEDLGFRQGQFCSIPNFTLDAFLGGASKDESLIWFPDNEVKPTFLRIFPESTYLRPAKTCKK